MNKLVVLVPLLASLVAAQLDGLPTCAVSPAVQLLGSSTCGITNFQCLCDDSSLIDSLQSAVQSACTDAADISSGIAAAESICAPYGGVALSTSGAGASITPTATMMTTYVAGNAGSGSSAATATPVTPSQHGYYAISNGSTATGSSGGMTSTTGSPLAMGEATNLGKGRIMLAGLMAAVAVMAML